jgi:hypothetical protein|eukprot:COSAG01_NODE_7354_length_3239_cov_2.627707_3_plen_49_part_00
MTRIYSECPASQSATHNHRLVAYPAYHVGASLVPLRDVGEMRLNDVIR